MYAIVKQWDLNEISYDEMTVIKHALWQMKTYLEKNKKHGYSEKFVKNLDEMTERLKRETSGY